MAMDILFYAQDEFRRLQAAGETVTADTIASIARAAMERYDYGISYDECHGIVWACYVLR